MIIARTVIVIMENRSNDNNDRKIRQSCLTPFSSSSRSRLHSSYNCIHKTTNFTTIATSSCYRFSHNVSTVTFTNHYSPITSTCTATQPLINIIQHHHTHPSSPHRHHHTPGASAPPLLPSPQHQINM